MLLKRLHSLEALVLAVLAPSALGQVHEFKHVQGGRIGGVFFLDPSHGWTAEDGARIRKTNDGGITWVYDHTPDDVREELHDVFFRDATHGWAVGTGGVVLGWNSAAGQWDKLNPTPVLDRNLVPAPAELHSIFMLTDTVGWAGGDDGAFWMTVDNWQSWSYPGGCSLPSGFTGEDPFDVYEIYFWSPSVGYAAADFGLAYRTTNGGCTWQPVSVGTPDCWTGPAPNIELWDFEFADAQNGWMVGGIGVQDGYAYRTDDGGLSWDEAFCFKPTTGEPADCTPPTLYGVALLGTFPRAVIAGYAASAMVYETGTATLDTCMCPSPPTSGPCAGTGTFWIQKNQPPPPSIPAAPPLFAAARINATQVCVAGAFGVIRRLDTAPEPDVLIEEGTVDPQRLEAGAFTSATAGCVIGQGQVIKRTTNSGQTWSIVHPVPLGTPDHGKWGRDLNFSTSGVNGVAVGDAGFTAWSSNSGASWTQNTVGTLNFQCVAFVPGSNTVFAGAVGGLLRKSVNGGATWTVPPQPGTTATITGIAFADAQNGYLVGTGETAFRTSDGGATWIPVEAVDNDGVTTDFLAVATWGNGTPAMAVGSGGRVYEKTGSRFNKVNLVAAGVSVTSTLTDVEAFASGTDLRLRICGGAGVMLFRDNGTWSQPKSQTNEDHKALSFRTADLGYAIGVPFLITKYE